MLRQMAKLEIPPDLRTRLEQARLDLKALFRALDGLDLSPDEIPQRRIRQLFELDADFAEALWALDIKQIGRASCRERVLASV